MYRCQQSIRLSAVVTIAVLMIRVTPLVFKFRPKHQWLESTKIPIQVIIQPWYPFSFSIFSIKNTYTSDHSTMVSIQFFYIFLFQKATTLVACDSLSGYLRIISASSVWMLDSGAGGYPGWSSTKRTRNWRYPRNRTWPAGKPIGIVHFPINS